MAFAAADVNSSIFWWEIYLECLFTDDGIDWRTAAAEQNSAEQ